MLKFYNLSSKNGASLSFFPFSWLSDRFGFFLMWILIDKFLLMKILSVLLGGHKSHHYFFFTKNEKEEKIKVLGILIDLHVFVIHVIWKMEALLSDVFVLFPQFLVVSFHPE